jgi:hypothetical protein
MTSTRGFITQLTILIVWSLVSICASVSGQEPGPPPNQTPRTGRPYTAAELPKKAPSAGPQGQSPVKFADIASTARLYFKQASSPTSVKYLLETMGGGVAVLDYDNDGRLDIFFTNGALLKDPMNRNEMPDKGDRKFWDRLYRQKSDGTFEDVTERSGLKGSGYSMGVAAGDYDNDGYVDLYVTGYGENFLYRNLGNGGFSDVTTRVNVTAGGWSTSAGWFDYDRDGRLDLFVARYLGWDFDRGSLVCGDTRPASRAYCHPDNFSGATNVLYRQKANGTFEDVSNKAGISDPSGKALGLAFADFDNDGWTDVFVANDSMRQSLYHNNGDGTFSDIAVMAGAGFNENGKTFAGMGVDAADFNNDGFIDIFITTLSNETYPLFQNNGDLSFTWVTNTLGVGQISLIYTGWGTRFIDVDNDGWRDIFVAQSHVLDTIEKSTSYLRYKQVPLLMRNTGKGFVNISATAGGAFSVPVAGRGAAFGDLNNDGQIDAIVNVLNDDPLVLTNGGTKNSWIGVVLSGARSNRQGIGARVAVTDSKGRKQIFDVSTAGSYLSSNDARVIAGIGDASAVKTIEVNWPSGLNQKVSNPGRNRYLKIDESNANQPRRNSQ